MAKTAGGVRNAGRYVSKKKEREWMKPNEWKTVYRCGKGEVRISRFVKEGDSDFEKLVTVAEFFAKRGSVVCLTPKMERPPKFEYSTYYSTLIGTKYEGKCPDLMVGGRWYEHEGFVSNNPKNAFRNMLNDGLKQASRLVIDKPNLTDAYMKRVIHQRIKDGHDISEIWLKDGDDISLFYKKV